MEEIVYVSVRLICAAYILKKVWGFKAEVRQVCDLFCDSARQGEVKKEESVQINNGAVIGETKFVYLDENAGTAVAPYMSQPLESAAIEEAGDIIEADDVECNLPLEEMKLLKEEQEGLDADIPEVETISEAVTQADLENMGDVLFRIDPRCSPSSPRRLRTRTSSPSLWTNILTRTAIRCRQTGMTRLNSLRIKTGGHCCKMRIIQERLCFYGNLFITLRHKNKAGRVNMDFYRILA